MKKMIVSVSSIKQEEEEDGPQSFQLRLTLVSVLWRQTQFPSIAENPFLFISRLFSFRISLAKSLYAAAEGKAIKYLSNNTTIVVVGAADSVEDFGLS